MIQQIITTVGMELVSIMLPVLCAVLVNEIHQGAKQLKAKAELTKEQTTKAFLEKAIYSAEELALTTVTAMEQTTAAELREKVKDGIVSKDELKELSVDVYNQMVYQLKEEYQEVIRNTYGDLRLYLTDLIEKKLYEVKNTKYVKKG